MNRKYLLDSLDGLKGLVFRLLPAHIRESIACVPMTADGPWTDDLTFDGIYFSVLHGEVIESYPTDKPYPSCQIYGKTFSGNPIHSVWAFNEEHKWVMLVTVYRPGPTRWINWRERKR